MFAALSLTELLIVAVAAGVSFAIVRSMTGGKS